MRTVQENIDLGMSLTQALQIATEVNKKARADGEITDKGMIYDRILSDAELIQPRILEFINKVKKE